MHVCLLLSHAQGVGKFLQVEYFLVLPITSCNKSNNVVLGTTYNTVVGRKSSSLPIILGMTIMTFIVVNLKQWLIIHNGELCNVCYGMEHCSMPMQWMPVGV